MTSLREQVYAVAAADAAVLALLPDGLLGLLGGPASAPPPAPSTPYLYLQFDAEVPRGERTFDGVFRWRAYDGVEVAGYERINRLLGAVVAAYPDPEGMGSFYYDPATGQDVYLTRFAGLGPEVEDQGRTLLTRWAEWAYRVTWRPVAVAP